MKNIVGALRVLRSLYKPFNQITMQTDMAGHIKRGGSVIRLFLFIDRSGCAGKLRSLKIRSLLFFPEYCS